MKHSCFSLPSAALCVAASFFLMTGFLLPVCANPPATKIAMDGKTELKLVWNDEFTGEGLPDPEKWGYEHGFVRNAEKQFYTRARTENARQENGVLIIESHKENWEENGQKADYTSASVTTRGKASWSHGRMEVRAKLPAGRGTWPAIWMLGDSISKVGWPACGEIDIMEYVGFTPETVYANIHVKKYNHSVGTGKGSHLKLNSPETEFHVYAVEWNAEKMMFSVDGNVYFTYENEETGEDAWPYNSPHYLILNTAIGGAWGGQKGIDDEIFPVRFEIDYVRMYQGEK